MVLYADKTITPQKDSLEKMLTQGFENTAVCTPELIAIKKQIDSAGKCVMPTDITGAQVSTTVETIIQQLQDTKKKLLTGTVDAELLDNPAALFTDLKTRIARVKDATDYLNEQKKAGMKELGSITLPSEATAAAAAAK
jgi:hypothetical protein